MEGVQWSPTIDPSTVRKNVVLKFFVLKILASKFLVRSSSSGLAPIWGTRVIPRR